MTNPNDHDDTEIKHESVEVVKTKNGNESTVDDDGDDNVTTKQDGKEESDNNKKESDDDVVASSSKKKEVKKEDACDENEDDNSEKEEEVSSSSSPSPKKEKKITKSKVRKDIQDKIMAYMGQELQVNDRKDLTKNEVAQGCGYANGRVHKFFYTWPFRT